MADSLTCCNLSLSTQHCTFPLWKCLNELAFGTRDFCANYGAIGWGEGHGMAEKGFQPCFFEIVLNFCSSSIVP